LFLILSSHCLLPLSPSSRLQEIFKAVQLTLPKEAADRNKVWTADLMSRAYVLYRSVRGTKGVPFARDFVLNGRQEALAAPSLDIFFDDLYKAYSEEANKRGGDEDWGAHKEGAHRFSSGGRVLRALAESSEARDAFADVSADLQPYVLRILQGSAGHPVHLQPGDTEKIGAIFEGRLVVGLSTRNNPKRARGYSAMDFARLFVSWGYHTGRLGSMPLNSTDFAWLKARQSNGKKGEVGDVFSYFGVEEYEEFAILLKRYEAVAPRSQHDEWGFRIFEGPTWSSLLVCLCESKQAINFFGLQAVALVAARPELLSEGAVVEEREYLRAHGTSRCPNECHMRALVRVALACAGDEVLPGRGGGRPERHVLEGPARSMGLCQVQGSLGGSCQVAGRLAGCGRALPCLGDERGGGGGTFGKNDLWGAPGRPKSVRNLSPDFSEICPRAFPKGDILGAG